MDITLPFKVSDISHLSFDRRLIQCLMVAEAFGQLDDPPPQIIFDHETYVLDDDEISVTWKDDPATTSSIYLRQTELVLHKWSDNNGRDSVTVSVQLASHRRGNYDSLIDLNRAITE